MTKTKKIITKQDLKWYFALSFVDLAETLGVYYSDNGFYNIVKEMRDYVNDKIALPTDDEITDMYVRIEQEVPVEESN